MRIQVRMVKLRTSNTGDDMRKGQPWTHRMNDHRPKVVVSIQSETLRFHRQKPVVSSRRKTALWLAVLCILPLLVFAQWHFTSPLYYDTGDYRSTDVFTDSDGSFVAHVLIAEGEQKLEKGLMGRELNETEGMLLVFTAPRTCSITMRDMNENIDILFIDSKQKVVEMRLNAPPMSSDPSTWGSYKTDKQCLFVLELHAGRVPALGISNGALLNFTV